MGAMGASTSWKWRSEGRRGQEAASSGQLGGLLGQAGSVELIVDDFREFESYCCRQMMRQDLQN